MRGYSHHTVPAKNLHSGSKTPCKSGERGRQRQRKRQTHRDREEQKQREGRTPTGKKRTKGWYDKGPEYPKPRERCSTSLVVREMQIKPWR